LGLTGSPPRTERSQQKADRRDHLLRVAAELFAERGFHAVSLAEIGAAAGITGPAVYRHFDGKQDVLANLLVGVSTWLLDEGRRVVATAGSGRDALHRLVAFHTDFALTKPDLIRVQERDLANLTPTARALVRRLQRGYVEIWVSVLTGLDPELSLPEARIRAHATFGLLNSTPHSAKTDLEQTRRVLEDMAMAGLLLAGCSTGPARLTRT